MFDTITNPDFTKTPRTLFNRHQATEEPVLPVPSIAKVKAAARRQQAARTASELFAEIPAPGESLHALLNGAFDLSTVIVSLVDRLPQCSELIVATLSYNRRSATELLGLLERRPTLRFSLLVSSFFVSSNRGLHDWFIEQAGEFPLARIGHSRSHAKVALFSLGENDALVIESSANLRTNGNKETATAIRDKPLRDFHAKWILELLVQNDEREKETTEV